MTFQNEVLFLFSYPSNWGST